MDANQGPISHQEVHAFRPQAWAYIFLLPLIFHQMLVHADTLGNCGCQCQRNYSIQCRWIRARVFGAVDAVVVPSPEALQGANLAMFALFHQYSANHPNQSTDSASSVLLIMKHRYLISIPATVSDNLRIEVAGIHAWFFRQTLLLLRLPHNPRIRLPCPALPEVLAMASFGIAYSKVQPYQGI